MQRPNWLLVLATPIALLGCITSSPGEYGITAESKKTSLPVCPQGRLDDLEDNNNQVIVQGGRNGYWFTFGDQLGSTWEPKGEFTPAPGGPPGSRYAANLHGKMAPAGDSLYVGVGFALTNPKTPFDLSQAKGISFWAKGPGRVRFKTPDIDTEPSGDRCTDCYNDFGVDIYLSDQWVRYTVPFEKMTQQPGWGDRAPAVAPEAIFAIQWQYSTPNTDYDIWFDNIDLVGCEG
jgi:endoglucanase